MVDSITDDLVTQAKAYLQELSERWPKYGICFGGTMTLTGAQDDGHTACHSWVTDAFRRNCFVGSTYDFSYKEYPKKAETFFVANCHGVKQTRASREATIAAVEYIAKESPFSKYILNRDDPESLQHGIVILCGPGGASLAETQWICKFLRYSNEGDKALDSWYAFYKGGVNPLLAAYAASFLSSVKGAGFGAAAVTGHTLIFEYPPKMKAPDLNALLNGIVDPNAINTSAVFGSDPEGKAYSTKIKGFCKTKPVSDGWGGTVKGAGASKDELIQNLLVWQEEISAGKAPAKKPIKPTKTTVFLEEDM